MFRISFSDISRSLLKANKSLKSKKGHTLMDAERYLNEAKKNLKNTETLTINLTDVDNGLDYIFDNIKIHAASPELMEIIENEITTSGHEDAQRLLNDLGKSYQEEKSENKQNSRVKTKRKKPFSLFKSKKIQKEDGNDISKDSVDDFEELEEINIQADFQEVEPVYEDVQEITVEENDQIPEVDEDEREHEHEHTENLDDPAEFIEEEPPKEVEEFPLVNSYMETEEENPIEIDEDFITGEDPEDQKFKQESKHERVTFPSYGDYLDLSVVDNTISRFKERFEKEHLVKFLGLNALSNDSVVTELDAIKLNYAINALDESDFILLKDFFHNSISNIKDKTQTQLTQVYEKAMMFDYEEEANKSLNDNFQSLLEKSENALTEYESEQVQEYELKLEKFDQEQEKALEDFKRKQALDRSIYVQELDAKKSNRIAVYKDEVQRDLNQKKEDLIDNKMFELKYQSINELTETKRIAIKNFESQLDNAMDDIWDNLQTALKTLKEDIQGRIPAWKAEIKEKQRMEAEQREEARKQEELEIEKEKIDLQRRQLEKNDEEEQREKEAVASLEKKIEDYTDKVTFMVSQSQMQQPISNEATKEDKQDKSNTSKLLAIGISAVLLLGGGTLLGKTLDSSDVEAANQEIQSQEQYQEIVNSISLLEDKLSETDSEEETEDTLKTLLKEKDYDKAIKEFDDKESLNTIETAIFQDKNVDELAAFNDKYKTIYGELDEAILMKELDTICNIYEEMSEDEKASLTQDRKEEIAFLFYQEGETDLANLIIGKKEK